MEHLFITNLLTKQRKFASINKVRNDVAMTWTFQTTTTYCSPKINLSFTHFWVICCFRLPSPTHTSWFLFSFIYLLAYPFHLKFCNCHFLSYNSDLHWSRSWHCFWSRPLLQMIEAIESEQWRKLMVVDESGWQPCAGRHELH